MGLRWNQTQKGIYELISAGVPKREIKAKGYKEEMIKKVKKAVNKGDIPGKPPETKKEPPPGEPLFSATLKTTKVTLDPIVAVRYDSVRHALGLGNDYTFQQFIDESTDIITELVGAVPPGFVKEEEVKEVTAV